jgi:hypothetical protein
MSSEVAAPAAAAAASAPSAPVAIVYASPPVPAESLSPAPQSIVEVEEDPTMKEALADQREKAPLIAEFRTKLAPFFAEHPDSQLVREAQGSDRVVYRFLQARKFDLPKAELLFKDAIKMRDEKKLDGILHRPIPKGLEYKIVSVSVQSEDGRCFILLLLFSLADALSLVLLLSQKHGWHGFDRYGRPIFIKNTGLQNFKALYSTGELEERVAYNTYLNEYLRYVIMPAANARIGHAYAIDQVVTIVNLKDFGFHCIKKHNYGQ